MGRLKKIFYMGLIGIENNHMAVVIPAHKSHPSKNELLSFEKCAQILGNHPIVIVTTRDVSLKAYERIFPEFEVEIFNNGELGSIAAYNRLMLSRHFYERFSQYHYILIYQLDALVFKDELTAWARKGYDYIGAPWLKFPLQLFFSVAWHVSLTDAFKVFSRKMLKNPVGNGGLSLRKVESCLQAIEENQDLISRWHANEDFFWSYYATKNGEPLTKPPEEEAVNFAVETMPRTAFKRLSSTLPFGVHDWETYDKKFWLSMFQKHGYFDEKGLRRMAGRRALNDSDAA